MKNFRGTCSGLGEGRPSSPLFPTQQYSRFQRTVNRTRATTVRFFLQREKTVELTRYFSRSAKVKGRPGCFLRTGSRSGISILPACVDVDASRGGPSETAILPGKKGESAVLMKFSGLVGIRGSLFQRVPKREPGQPGCSREAAHLTTPLQAPRPRPWAWRVGPTGHAAAHPAVPGEATLPSGMAHRTHRPRRCAPCGSWPLRPFDQGTSREGGPPGGLGFAVASQAWCGAG